MQSQREVKKNILKDFEKALPPVFARCALTKLTGGLIHERTIANLMCQGVGPDFFRLGRKVGFRREVFLDWLSNNIQIVTE